MCRTASANIIRIIDPNAGDADSVSSHESLKYSIIGAACMGNAQHALSMLGNADHTLLKNVLMDITEMGMCNVWMLLLLTPACDDAGISYMEYFRVACRHHHHDLCDLLLSLCTDVHAPVEALEASIKAGVSVEQCDKYIALVNDNLSQAYGTDTYDHIMHTLLHDCLLHAMQHDMREAYHFLLNRFPEVHEDLMHTRLPSALSEATVQDVYSCILRSAPELFSISCMLRAANNNHSTLMRWLLDFANDSGHAVSVDDATMCLAAYASHLTYDVEPDWGLTNMLLRHGADVHEMVQHVGAGILESEIGPTSASSHLRDITARCSFAYTVYNNAEFPTDLIIQITEHVVSQLTDDMLFSSSSTLHALEAFCRLTTSACPHVVNRHTIAACVSVMPAYVLVSSAGLSAQQLWFMVHDYMMETFINGYRFHPADWDFTVLTAVIGLLDTDGYGESDLEQN